METPQSPETPQAPSVEPQAVPPSELDVRTRNRLLRAAVQVFDRKGYAASSVREIVEAAGVTKPALYYHFGSKEGMLLAILNEGVREFEGAIERAVGRPGTARERVTALGEDLFGLFEKNVPAVRVSHSVFLGPADTAPRFDFTQFDRILVRGLRQIVEAGQAAGELTPALAEDVALAVIGVIGACVARQLHPELEPVGVETLRRVIDLVFEGVLAERRSSGEGRHDSRIPCNPRARGRRRSAAAVAARKDRRLRNRRRPPASHRSPWP